ncbi:MAG: hypothetical protein WAL45_03025 [Terracidiphilus sp.]
MKSPQPFGQLLLTLRCAAEPAVASISSFQDYGTKVFRRYPDPVFLLPISAVAQIFMHNRAISGVGWKLLSRGYKWRNGNMKAGKNSPKTRA